MPSKERVIKILPKHFSRVWKNVVFPEIRLAGKWLQDMGFTCGRYITISQDEGTIIIKMLPEVKLQPIVQKPKRKEGPQMPLVLQNASNYELLNVYAEEYRQHMEAVKQWKRDKKEKAQKNRIKKSVRGFKTTNANIIQLHAEPALTAPPDEQIIRLHPEISQAADGPNFDTIA